MSEKKNGFTLIELLVVIAIIGLLATMAVVSFGNARARARDAKRLTDMAQIQKALELYFDEYEQFPTNTDNDAAGWDIGFNGGPGSGDPFIQPLVTAGFIGAVGDPTGTNSANTYRYYRYVAGSYGCTVSKGAFYVLGVADMETSDRPHPASPGWSCPGRNWQTEIDWVVGKFEK